MRRRPCSRSLATLLVTFIGVFAHPATLKAADGVAPDKATFAAGQETKIADLETGGLGWYVVYVPKDYTPDREWPILFCYHGKNGDPTTWPFRQLTDGQSFIIVGMEYLDRETRNEAAEDVANLGRTLEFVSSKLKVNRKLMFMGGFSQGGWSTARFSSLMIDELAGIAILGAGGAPTDKAAARIKGKPVFIGIGEKDEYHKQAVAAKEAYAARGADVTWEEFAGLGHSVDAANKPLKDWLLKHGPHNQTLATVARARAAEKANKLGEAYTLYAAAGAMSGGKDAADRAKEIGDAAEAKLAHAEASVKSKKYPDAVKTLVAAGKTYAGSTFATRADERLKQIRSDPAIKAEVEQATLDARADATEAQGKAAEKAKDYARAIALYETYVTQFPRSKRFEAVKKRLDALKADPAIVAAAKNQSAERECKGWLSAADNYLKNGLPEKAKPYLQKILDKYDDTEWGAAARERMKRIAK